MPAKTPIYLKANPAKKGKKCRLRDILSPDMISPPLGDFRHTVHIGKGGPRDTFGDMSFLQGKFELLPGKVDTLARAHYQQQHGVASSSQHSEFLRANSASDASSFAETPSPVLKNAISLPTIGTGQALTLPMLSSAIFPMASDPLEEPLEDLLEPLPESLTSSSSSEDGAEEEEDGEEDETGVQSDHRDALEILQIDSLLQSITIFGHEPSPPPAEFQERPALTINLVETNNKPPSPAKKKASPKIGKIPSFKTSLERKQQPLSLYFNGNKHTNSFYSDRNQSNGVYNGSNESNNIYNSNNHSTNIRNSVSDSNQTSKTYSGSGHSNLIDNGSDHRNDIYKDSTYGNSTYNGNDNCNSSSSGYTRSSNGSSDLNSFSLYNDIGLLCEKESNSVWTDRDSGVEDSRLCDFDFELSKDKSVSQESLSRITGSLLSLELDLGPSFLDDVLNIMDKPVAGVKG